MMFQSKLATFWGAIILASASFSGQYIPTVCPSSGLIQAEGLTMSEEIMDGLYVIYNNLNHYDTPANWIFILGPIKAESDLIALEEGNRILATLAGNPTPQEVEEDSWLCHYETGNPNLTAFAIQVDNMISPLKMGHFLSRTR